MRMLMLRFVQQPSYPQIITGQRKRGSKKRGKEGDDTRRPSAPTAYMDGINRTTHVGSLVLVGIERTSCNLSASGVEIEAIARTKTIASGGNYTCRAVGNRYLTIARMRFRQCIIDFLPMGERAMMMPVPSASVIALTTVGTCTSSTVAGTGTAFTTVGSTPFSTPAGSVVIGRFFFRRTVISMHFGIGFHAEQAVKACAIPRERPGKSGQRNGKQE